MIQIKNLHKTYLDGDIKKDILEGVSFTLPKGKSLAITGESGCGKSSLLNILSTLDTADSGEAWVNSKNVIDMTERQANLYRKQDIGIIFQRFNLIDCLSVRDNIELPARLNRKLDEDYLNQVIKILGLSGHLDKLPAYLSGGEQQRVAIARALSHRPSLIFADEPTGNLDDKNSDVVADLLFELCERFKTTLFLVTHSSALAKRAHFTRLLRNGKLDTAQC
jgi:putative ABC transport system ATP-binding protein